MSAERSIPAGEYERRIADDAGAFAGTGVTKGTDGRACYPVRSGSVPSPVRRLWHAAGVKGRIHPLSLSEQRQLYL